MMDSEYKKAVEQLPGEPNFEAFQALSQHQGDDIHESLERGIAILETDEQCSQYMFSFARRHNTKIRRLFKLLPERLFDDVLEIVDWGCGIGVGLIAFNDFLKQDLPAGLKLKHKSKVRQIVLVEPSPVALEWAKTHVKRCFPESHVSQVAKQFQDLNSQDFQERAKLFASRLHFFFNVLDLPVFNDREWLKSFINKLQGDVFTWDDYIVLLSPNYNKVKDTFAFFSDCFAHDKSLTLDKIKEPFVDENQRMAAAILHITSNTKRDFLLKCPVALRHFIDEVLLDDDIHGEGRKLIETVYRCCKDINDESLRFLYKPNIVGVVPDLLIVRRGYRPILLTTSNDTSYMDNARKNIFNLGCKKLNLKNNEKGNKLFGKIQCLSVAKFSGKSFELADWFSDELYEELIALTTPQFVKTNIGDELLMDTKQDELSISRTGEQRKIKGVVGSGKTTVLVRRAISAYERTHQQILILTYNITLRSHIENILRVHFGSFTRNQFYVIHIHSFIQAEMAWAKQQGFFTGNFDDNIIDFMEQENLYETCFGGKEAAFRKYPVILIDEVQDYRKTWLDVIKKVFLASPGGEYVLFGDVKQNIYGQKTEDKECSTNISGNWNKLIRSYRANPIIVERANRFQKYMDRYEPEAIENNDTLFDSSTDGAVYVNTNELTAECFVRRLLKTFPNVDDYGKIAVIGHEKRFLQNVESCYRKQSRCETETTFIRLEDAVRPYSSKRMSDVDIDRMEKIIKLHFNGDRTDCIKFATIESFKGYEADIIFAIVDPDLRDDVMMELTYTAFTRARKSVYIIDRGDSSRALSNILREVFTAG